MKKLKQLMKLGKSKQQGQLETQFKPTKYNLLNMINFFKSFDAAIDGIKQTKSGRALLDFASGAATVIAMVFLVLAALIAILWLSVITFPSKETISWKEQSIKNDGVDGYCRDEASQFVKNTFDNKWGSEAERGNITELQTKVYNDCLEFNKDFKVN